VCVFCGTEKIESEYTENFQVHLRGCRYHPCHSPLATRIFNTSPFCCTPYSNSSKNARTKYTDKIGHGRKTPYGRLVNDVVQKTLKQPITTIPGIQSSKRGQYPTKIKLPLMAETQRSRSPGVARLARAYVRCHSGP
jgi:hypothetical protein